APATGTITEIGWWLGTGTSNGQNWECGIYSDDGAGATSLPVTLQAGSDTSNVLGTVGTWQVCTGLSIAITSGTVYWLAIQADTVGNNFTVDGETGILRRSNDTAHTTALPGTWTDAANSNNAVGIYALYTTTVVSEVVKSKKLATLGVG